MKQLKDRDPTLGHCYWQGQRAAEAGLACRSCPYGDTQLRSRCEWLAGHYDRATEMGTLGLAGYAQEGRHANAA